MKRAGGERPARGSNAVVANRAVAASNAANALFASALVLLVSALALGCQAFASRDEGRIPNVGPLAPPPRPNGGVFAGDGPGPDFAGEPLPSDGEDTDPSDDDAGAIEPEDAGQAAPDAEPTDPEPTDPEPPDGGLDAALPDAARDAG